MSYLDKKFGLIILPTRTGVAAGGAIERSMLDRMCGAQGYRKDFRANPDGSITMLVTKNGDPQFSTTKVAASAPTTSGYSIYMESGTYEWSFPGPLNPARGDAATLHLTEPGISPTLDYMGLLKFATTDTRYALGTASSGEYTALSYADVAGEDNDPDMADLQPSLSVGYPVVKTTIYSSPAEIISAAAINAATKAEYEDRIVAKKLFIAYCNPGLFSGKMRAFMQAQYGAEAEQDFQWRLDTVGESVTFMYHGTGYNPGPEIQIGIWSYSYPGITVCEDDRTFWMVYFSNAGAGADYVVRAFPIKQRDKVAFWYQYYKNRYSVLSKDIRAKLEAYIFAYSYIDTSDSHVIGTFPNTAGGNAATLAYAWKFNSLGTQAKITTHATVGFTAGTQRWSAFTTTVDISITKSLTGYSFEIAAETTAGADWTDGWGVYNIFGPEDPLLAAPLSCRSIKINNLILVKPDFDFEDVEVYGYYDSNDEWVSVTITRVVDNTPAYRQEMSNVNFAPGVDSTVVDAYVYGYILSSGGWSHLGSANSTSTQMNITVHGVPFVGSSIYGDHYATIGQAAGGGLVVSGVPSQPPSIGSTPYGGVSPPGWDTYGLGALWEPFPPASNFLQGRGICSEITHSWTGSHSKAWVLVIPCGDCESAYVTTRTVDANGGGAINSNITIRRDITMRFGRYFPQPTGGYILNEFTPWSSAPNTGYFGDGDAGSSSVDGHAMPDPYPDLTVHCFNKYARDLVGTPANDYTTLYFVDKDFPFYTYGITTYTSAGGRYSFSDGPKHPETLTGSKTFTGWA